MFLNCDFKIIRLLQIQPELRGCSQPSTAPECGDGGDATPPAHDFRDAIGGDAKDLSELLGAHPEFYENILFKNLSGMNVGLFSFCHVVSPAGMVAACPALKYRADKTKSLRD
jgi:hypothetical protein